MVPVNPLVQATQLSAELLRIRSERRLKASAVAEALGWSGSKVSRYETHKTGVTVGDVERLLDYYDVHGAERARLLTLAHGTQIKAWWEDYDGDFLPGQAEMIGFEQGAETIQAWQPDTIPDLLQTDGYAEAVIASYADVASLPPVAVPRLVRLRQHRKRVLNRKPAPAITMLIDEAVLHRPAGGNEVMRQQLERLAGWGEELGCLTVRVLPHGSPARLASGPFTVFGFGGAPGLPDVVSIEHMRGVEFCRSEEDAWFYLLAFGRMAAAALDTRASRSLILKAAREYD